MQMARAPTTVSSPSCCCWGRSEEITCNAMATAMQIATAAAVPIQTWRSASLRPCCPRNAAMIPTIRAASSPSRSPITNVGSTSRPSLSVGRIVQATRS
jgi:hypothetical protein